MYRSGIVQSLYRASLNKLNSASIRCIYLYIYKIYINIIKRNVCLFERAYLMIYQLDIKNCNEKEQSSRMNIRI